MHDWIIRHPYLIGAALAALAWSTAFNMFRAGLAVGEMRATAIDFDRLASEALGG